MNSRERIITKQERAQIKILIQDPKFRVVEDLANLLCDKIAYESSVKESQWETLKTTCEQEGKIRGIKQLIQELYEEANKSE